MNAGRALRRWSRATLLDVALHAYFLLLVILALFLTFFSTVGELRIDRDLWNTLGHVLTIAAIAYGWFRASYFHPLLHRSYGRWLRQSPWSPGDPLPLGPAGLTVQDGVFLGVVAATLPIALPDRLTQPLLAFALGYGACLWRAAIASREWGFAYGFPALVGGGVLVAYAAPTWLPAVAIAGLLLSQFSLKRGLHRLPAVDPRRVQPLVMTGNRRATRRKLAESRPAGSPATELLADAPEARWPQGHAIATGSLTGWLAFCALHPLADLLAFGGAVTLREVPEAYASFASLPVVLTSVPAVLRLFCYCQDYLPPISLFGRLATGRLILPGYDKVAAAPLVGLVAAAAASQTLLVTGAPLPASVALASALGVALVLGLPPSLEDWRHTGHHRLRLRDPRHNL